MKRNILMLLLSMCFIVACGKKNKLVEVTTLAGSGTMKFADGKGTDASFSNLMGLAVDSGGNIYVADSRNNKIRKVSADGTVTTIAGSGKDGSEDGKGSSASFFFPVAIAAGTNGNVYVADTHNSLVRKISADGTVTTLLGRNQPVKKDLSDSLQKLDNPYGIAVGKDGTIYFTDWAKDLVCKITPDGKLSEVAGNGAPGSTDGKAHAASFYLPEGIAVDDHNNLYISDCYNNTIRKIDSNGVVTTLAGRAFKRNQGAKDGKGAAASFNHPCGIAVDKAGNVYVADVGNHKIRKIIPDGTVSTFAGTGKRGATNGDAATATFNRPFGVAVDKAGNIYVADYQNNLVRKIGN
ncbi:MAG: NHL repeat-containing protein [Sphingobacteriales bacterium]